MTESASDDIIQPQMSPAVTMEVQVYLMLSKIAAKQDVLRERFESHTRGEHVQFEAMASAIQRIEAKLEDGTKAFRLIEERIDAVEKDLSWAKGGKSAIIGGAVALASVGGALGWLVSTLGWHIATK